MPIGRGVIASLSSSADISLGQAEQIYVMFIDLCDSTAFKSYCSEASIPDQMWIERQLIFLHRCIGLVERYGGKPIKTIGDETMAYFPSRIHARDVLQCATDAHSLFRSIDKYSNDQWKIRSKVSVDFGSVFDSNFGLVVNHLIDPVGIVVDRCARLNKEAGPNQVAFSSSVFGRLRAVDQRRYSKSGIKRDLSGVGPSEFYLITVE